ncbi:unnamed protein product [Alopecurus aequalis]
MGLAGRVKARPSQQKLGPSQKSRSQRPAAGWFLQDPDVSAAPQRNQSGNGGAAHAEGPRKRRRRARPAKSLEEVESRRMTHITVERSRRRQTKEYLAKLRSLMPSSYVNRVTAGHPPNRNIRLSTSFEEEDQALTINRIIRFKFEPEYPVCVSCTPTAIFLRGYKYPSFFPKTNQAFPSTFSLLSSSIYKIRATSGSKPSAVADVEVTMVESRANQLILSRRRPRQLLRLVVALHGRRLTVLHLNMTSAGHMVLNSLNLKVEDDCRLFSEAEIATTAHQVVEKIQQEMESVAYG